MDDLFEAVGTLAFALLCIEHTCAILRHFSSLLGHATPTGFLYAKGVAFLLKKERFMSPKFQPIQQKCIHVSRQDNDIISFVSTVCI